LLPTNHQFDITVSGDELEVFFSRDATGLCLFTATRSDRTAIWGAWARQTTLCGGGVRPIGASLTPDGLGLYYNDGDSTVLFAARSSRAVAFSPGTAVPALTTTGTFEGWPTGSSDGLTLYFQSDRGGSADIYVTSRASTSASFGTASLVASLSTASAEGHPSLSEDGLELYFASDRDAAGGTGWDLYVAQRVCVR
jgi:hypothetical protein